MLTPLATTAHLQAFGYDAATVAPYLVRASTRVRRFLGLTISEVEDDEVTLLTAPYILPQTPVSAVVSVTTTLGTELVEDIDFTRQGPVLDIDPSWGAVTVVYDHGYTTIPDELADVVCSIAYRMSQESTGLVQGFQSEAGEGVTTVYGSDAHAGTTDLLKAEKAALRRLFPNLPRTVDVL